MGAKVPGGIVEADEESMIGCFGFMTWSVGKDILLGCGM